ncbi:MAG: hypothetical protein R2826_03500 [Thermoleophilia bacterium]
MIVRCIAVDGSALPTTSYDPRQGITADTEFPVTLGRRYAVYAITVYLGIAWYYIMDDDGNPWPVWTPAPLFEIADGSLPSSWQIGYFRFDREDQYPIVSFPEWASDHSFYERLVDRDAAAVRIFTTRRHEVRGDRG